MTFVCDFHVHSSASDGTLSPAQVVEAAHATGLDVIALTDHDTTCGIPAAQARGRQLGVEVWAGIELSVAEAEGRRQLHLLGLGIDPAVDPLPTTLLELQRARLERGTTIVRRLNDLGVKLSIEQVREARDDDLALDVANPGVGRDGDASGRSDPRDLAVLHQQDPVLDRRSSHRIERRADEGGRLRRGQRREGSPERQPAVDQQLEHLPETHLHPRDRFAANIACAPQQREKWPYVAARTRSRRSRMAS